jgi:formyl-CoA transferase
MSLPLAGTTVLDLSRVLAGPYCTMLLADLGADVIKVERPGTGDDTRHWGPPFVNGESAYFLSVNRNKRSIEVDLKHPRGRQLVVELARRADVFVENFLPGTLDGLGLGYQALSALNQRLVYCSITGFGQTGPRRCEPGYDIMVQAMAGVMSFTGEAEGRPMKLGVAIADLAAGMLAGNAILAALIARAASGRGDYLDLALFDCTLSWLANVGANYLLGGEVPQRLGTAHPNIVPYQAFAARDGELIIAVGNDRQFADLCRIIGREELALDPNYRTNAARVQNRQRLVPLITAEILKAPVQAWLERLHQAGVPCGPVNRVDQALTDPQVAARGMLIETDHSTAGRLKLVGSPLKFASGDPMPRRPPPRLGEHTNDLLREILGLSTEGIASLRATGALGGPQDA